MVRLALLVGILTLPFSPAGLRAQESSSAPTRAWVSVGLGGGLFSSLDDEPNDPGIALAGALVLKKDAHRFSLRGSIVAELFEDGVSDLGLLYGRAWTNGRSEWSVSAGAALVFGDDCHGVFGGSCQRTNVVGLPLSATLSFRPLRFLGLGVEAFADLNSLASFGGLTAILELGALR